MALPGVNIEFQNGQLGSVQTFPDGVFGLCASAVAVGSFELNKAYQIKSMVDVADLGIIDSVDNHTLYKALSEFYAEAGEGVELWLMGFAKDTKVSDWFTLDGATGKAPVHALLDKANGKLRMLFTVFNPDENYVLTVDEGIDNDVYTAANLAQQLADNYTANKYAPFYTVFEGYAFDGDKVALKDLSESSFNRVQIIIGDSETRTGTTASLGAAIGTFAGRLAAIQVHVNPGKVKDGATTLDEVFILDTEAELYDVEALHDKGYVTFRTHTSKSGYYFTDDPMATEVDDDYHYGTRRRVIDKAYRLAYESIVEFLLDDVDTLEDGTVSPIYAGTIEGNVETLIYSQMTLNGELSYDPNTPKDLGVICKVDLTNNLTSTSRLKLSKLQVRPKGYNRFIDVPLGFVPVNQ